jgi:hypothetical protein
MTRSPQSARVYHWDTPMCWIGDDLLAVSGCLYSAGADGLGI